MNNTIFCSPKQGGTIQKAYDRVINQEIGYTSSSNTVRKKHKDKRIIIPYDLYLTQTLRTILRSILSAISVHPPCYIVYTVGIYYSLMRKYCNLYSPSIGYNTFLTT